MAYTGSSDESSSFSQSNETYGLSQEDAPSGVIKGDRSDCGRNKTERQRIKSKPFAYSEDEQASPEHLSSGRTNKSVRDKTTINLKSVQKETVRQHDKNPNKVNRQNRKTPSQLTNECDYLDYQSDHNSTAGGPVPKYDLLPQVNESRSDKTKTKVSEKRQEKNHRGIDLENRPSISKTKSKDSENKLKYFDSERDINRENYSPRNHGMPDHPPKQQERTNKKGSTSNILSESLECEASENDSDTADHNHKKGRNNHKMTGKGSVPSIKGLESSSSNSYTHITNSKDGDENRSRRRSTCKNPDKSNGKIDDEGYGQDMHRGSRNATQGECETNKEHSKKSERSKEHARDMNNRGSSARSSSCSSSGSSGSCSSSINHDKNTSRSFVAGGGVNNHDGSSCRSSRSGSLVSIDNSSENSSRHCASISQGSVRGIAKTTTDKRSKASKTSRREDSSERTSDLKAKKSTGKKENDTDRASNTSRREDSSERTSDRRPKKSPGKKETDTDRASKTSRREDSSERTSDRRSKKSPGKKETDTDRASKTSRREDSSESSSDRRKSKKSCDKKKTDSDRASKTSLREDRSERSSYRKTKKSHDSKEIDSKNKTKGDGSNCDRKIYENDARRRSDSRGSSRERRRSHSNEKSRDKDSRREKGMHGNRNKESDRYHSSNDYDREKNRDKKPADIHKKNSSGTNRDRRDSRYLSEERAGNNRRKSSASSIDSGEYRDRPKRKEGHRARDYNEDSNDREAKYEQPNYKYEWQFENEHGNWITYGQSNLGRPLQGNDVVTSDDIEEFFSKHRGTRKPVLIGANNNQYFLDFIEMSQTNVKTSVRRRIRRVRKSEKQNYQSQNYNDDYHYVNARDYDVASSNFDRSSGRHPDTKDNQPTRKNATSTKFEWQFEDDTGNWITYGKTNSAKNRNTGSSTTSDDIEKFHASDPSKVSMQIRSDREQYILNFKQMTEVNIETLGHRRVRRVPKSSAGVLQSLAQWLGWRRAASSGSSDTDVERYEWQFQDERGAWITYGQASSNGITAFSTAASSDDIETYYSNSPDKAPISISSRTHTYVLDFKNMIQINQETLVQRPIRRVKKTSKDSNANHLGGVGQSGVTAGNGTNVGVNNLHNPANFGYGDGNFSQGFTQGVPRVNVGAGQHLNPPSFPCSWQFQDESGSWITYGQPSSTNQTAGSTTTSDDIEQYFSTNPGKTSMIIQSPYNQYVLDTQSMIQINQKTLAQKPVRRVMKQNIQPPLNFQQGF